MQSMLAMEAKGARDRAQAGEKGDAQERGPADRLVGLAREKRIHVGVTQAIKAHAREEQGVPARDAAAQEVGHD
jgi:hypothetical protein